MELLLHDVSESHHDNGSGGDGGSGHFDGDSLLGILLCILLGILLGILWVNPVGNRFSSDKGPGLVGEGVSVGGLSSDIPSRGGVRFVHDAREGSSDEFNSIDFVLVDGGEAVVFGLFKIGGLPDVLAISVVTCS